MLAFSEQIDGGLSPMSLGLSAKLRDRFRFELMGGCK